MVDRVVEPHPPGDGVVVGRVGAQPGRPVRVVVELPHRRAAQVRAGLRAARRAASRTGWAAARRPRPSWRSRYRWRPEPGLVGDARALVGRQPRPGRRPSRDAAYCVEQPVVCRASAGRPRRRRPRRPAASGRSRLSSAARTGLRRGTPACTGQQHRDGRRRSSVTSPPVRPRHGAAPVRIAAAVDRSDSATAPKTTQASAMRSAVPAVGGWTQPASSADTSRSSSASCTCTTETTWATASITTASSLRADVTRVRPPAHPVQDQTRPASSRPAVNGRL